MRWSDPRTAAAATLGLMLVGCAAAPQRKAAPAEPTHPAAEAQLVPPAAGNGALPELPPDALLILVDAKGVYTVQDTATSCQGLPELLAHYRQTNLVVAGGPGAGLNVADAICVGLAARQRGGKAYFVHPEGLRSIDIQD
ncbi:hypothetical protein [Tahibacter caeni]|uniref:hypothetical protein n=1 Tax=Tahibacter caeni TaxID=1453545 RepID=UPI002147D784|nr:hypothetical protein [Tahibacter caeni]